MPEETPNLVVRTGVALKGVAKEKAEAVFGPRGTPSDLIKGFLTVIENKTTREIRQMVMPDESNLAIDLSDRDRQLLQELSASMGYSDAAHFIEDFLKAALSHEQSAVEEFFRGDLHREAHRRVQEKLKNATARKGKAA